MAERTIKTRDTILDWIPIIGFCRTSSPTKRSFIKDFYQLVSPFGCAAMMGYLVAYSRTGETNLLKQLNLGPIKQPSALEAQFTIKADTNRDGSLSIEERFKAWQKAGGEVYFSPLTNKQMERYTEENTPK